VDARPSNPPPAPHFRYASYLLGEGGADTPESLILAGTSLYKYKYQYSAASIGEPVPTPSFSWNFPGPMEVRSHGEGGGLV